MVMLVFWAGVIALAYYAVRGRTRPPTSASRPRATDILDERFARGEITTDEHRESREALEATRSASQP